MNIEELFSGVGVVIDDKVFATDEADPDRILTIVRELENEKHFPLVKYKDLPSNEVLAKLGNISFLLLDWEIEPSEEQLGEAALDVSIGDTLKGTNENRVIEIVQTILNNSLIPVFIFSNQSIDSIKKKLKNAKVDLSKSQIYVESKSALDGKDQLFRKIEEWVDSVSGVYVAKVWDNAFCRAKNLFFAEMANNTSHWPKALFNAALEDTVDPGEEITQAISQNIISRMLPIHISQEQIDKDKENPKKEEVLGIMKGQFFLEKVSEVSIVGDFYAVKEQGHSEKYYINIRPTCDCLNRESNSGFIYFLECDVMSGGQLKKQLNQGHFSEPIDCAIVGPLYKGKYYRVKFKELRIGQGSYWKSRKVGRILPPIITHIAERYGLYIQRQALPRLPEEILPSMSSEESTVGKVESENRE